MCRSTVDDEHTDLITELNMCKSGSLTPNQDEGTALIDDGTRTLIAMSSFIFNNDDTSYVDHLAIGLKIQLIVAIVANLDYK